jgi:hypothetical protein
MTEREAILEAIRSRYALAPDDVADFALRVLNTLSTASLIEQFRYCATVLASRMVGDVIMFGDEQVSYDHWTAALLEICDAHIEGIKEAAKEKRG